MTKVFISYRRADSRHAAGRLFLALRAELRKEEIFFDVESIIGGADFVEDYKANIARSDVLLALIGPHWCDEQRLHDPGNHVRKELLAAREHSVEVLPLLLDDTQMPEPSELPPELHFVLTRNAERLTHSDFLQDTVKVLRSARGLKERRSELRSIAAPLAERMERDREHTKQIQQTLDLAGLHHTIRSVVERARAAELDAIEAQYRALEAVDRARDAARRAAAGEAGFQSTTFPIQGGNEGRWAGEGTWQRRNGFGENEMPKDGGGRVLYRGQWKDNHQSGYGVLEVTNADGSINFRSEGEMRGGKRSGFGFVSLGAGHCRIGEFHDGLLEGPGVYRWPDGTRFEGDWRSGKKNGLGVQWRNDGARPIEGAWNDEEMQIL